MEKFYPLTPLMTNRLRKADLTAAEWRLWSYLIELDPFGDRYQELPDLLTIMQVVGIRKSTFYAAIAKFQKAGLFDFQSRGFDFRNLCGAEASKNSENFPRTRKAFRKTGKNSEISESDSKISENRPSKPASQADFRSSQTIQTIQTLSDSPPTPPQTKEREERENVKAENARADGKENIEVICEKPKSINSSLTSNQNPGLERYSAPRVVQQKSTELHAALIYAGDDTPWLEPPRKGKPINFRYAFLEWQGKRWMQKYDKQDIHEAIGDFRRSLHNDPSKIQIAWEEYENQVLHHASNIQTRLENGCTITAEEQEKMKKHLPQIVNNQSRSTCRNRQVACGASPVPDAQNCLEATVEEVSPQLPPTAPTQENASAYALWKPKQEQEETVNAWEVLRGCLKNVAKPMPSRQPVQEVSRLEKLNSWFQDPVLRKEAIVLVNASSDFTFEFDDYGNAIAVIEVKEEQEEELEF